MLPSALRAKHFNGYPPEAKQLIISHLALLQQLPLSLVPLLLREAIEYDWKFPAERRALDHQLAYLAGLSAEQLRQLTTRFAELRLPHNFEELDWVNHPQQFSEQLTAHLWASRQIDAFRRAAIEFGQKTDAAAAPEMPPVPRLAIAVIGKGVDEYPRPLFRKLRPWGVYFKQVNPEGGKKIILDAVVERAAAHPVPFGHWYVDGDIADPLPSPGVTCLSYRALDRVRAAILAEMQRAIQSGKGPEALRTLLAQMRPSDIGLNDAGAEGILNRFRLSVLTEGSGTQLFSTTFVQWSAREAFRRAQPVTLLACFAPRQRNRPMNELIANPEAKPELDPMGSLIDADMGAYYIWLSQQRLSGSERSAFLVWFENHSEALAIGPALPRGTESPTPIGMQQLLQQL
ncbi:MAG TPA: hypothetical protein VFB14_16720 [Bryobacteraceae bacterium]|jgi:hypothetical protein|nr:hypothetical protein [Bryobacteraceae bacterium]